MDFTSTSCGLLLFVACNRIGKHMEPWRLAKVDFTNVLASNMVHQSEFRKPHFVML